MNNDCLQLIKIDRNPAKNGIILLRSLCLIFIKCCLFIDIYFYFIGTKKGCLQNSTTSKEGKKEDRVSPQ